MLIKLILEEIDLRDEYIQNNNLLKARRKIEEIPGVEIIEDLKWNPLINKWVLLCSLEIKISDNQLIPQSTHWYIHISDSYPWGEIKFFPSKINGIKQTFPHQNYNDLSDPNFPWSQGNLCLESTFKKFTKLGLDSEPYDSEHRLSWYVQRALMWLQDAETENLININEPFELPDFKIQATNTLAFSEDQKSYSKWTMSNKRYGLVDIKVLNKEELSIFIPAKFKTLNQEEVYQPLWGEIISEIDIKEQLIGAWILLEEVPVLPPWQAPMNWLELEHLCELQGIPLIDIVKKIASKLRDNRSHLFLFGFPIPEKNEGPFHNIFWQSMLIPKLCNLSSRKSRGFRDIEKENWFFDRKRIFAPNNKLVWLRSENWHSNELFNRGKLEMKRNVLQLGAGSVGSMVSEALVRGGQSKMTIMDDDFVVAGNMVRHTLTLKEILKFKAQNLSIRLNNISPHSNAIAINEKFSGQFNKEKLNGFDLILDCTGEDETLIHLSHNTLENKVIYFSISLGYGARRLFLFYSKGYTFSYQAYFALMNDWILKEKEETKNINFPREGIGCWHPVFPARYDDISAMVSIAIKNIESVTHNEPKHPTLLVYEQEWLGTTFKGINLVSKEEYCV